MSKTPAQPATVTNLVEIRRKRGLELPPLKDHSAPAIIAATPADVPLLVDLKGKRKLLLLLGRGNVGKTLVLRWILEMVERPPGSWALAAVDHGRRALADFFDDVQMPARGENVVRWLQLYLEGLMDDPALSAALDCGGDNPEILSLISQQKSRLLSGLSERGIETVLGVVFSPSRGEADVLRRLAQAEFCPQATMLILNRRHVIDDSQFDVLRAEPAYRAAVKQGAVEIFLPVNHGALAVEHYQLGFRKAVAVGSPIGWFDFGPNEEWLAEMPEAFKLPMQAGWLA